MGKISNRDRILTDGLQVVLERGYVGASVRDIVEAAGVPQGSFTNHFSSKEAFSLEILDRYFAHSRVVMADTLRNGALLPLKRIRAYIDASIAAIKNHGTKNGCLVGNFAAEASDHSEIIRKRVADIYAEVREAMTDCLKAAVKEGELSKSFKTGEVATFIVTGLQGAWLVSKVERDLAFAENFKKTLFSTVLAHNH
ncbi:MAG TPA: TetR family transcriptional regulator C-terminal domain-containing protein [Steroidobacteraceae bacterium]|jgi:TetR/AcrR family transcriptional regulator, transcriptional repressor for nem operon|nr:TetR family transcriptional regulator C-terminal domain-containing protein [Steroidobacteraceae bacterium]